LGHHTSGSTFPFSTSRFKGIPQAGDALPVGPVEPWRLAGAAVNTDYIDDRPAEPIGNTPPPPKPQPTRRAGRQIGLPSSLKLLPLQGFIWGGRAAAPLPRTRGEHVLIRVAHGALQLDFPRQRHVLGPDSLFYIPSGTAFAALPLADCAGEVLLIAPTLARDLSHPLPERALGGRLDHDDPTLRLLLQDLARETQRLTPDARTAIACQLSLLALRLARLEPVAQRVTLASGDTAGLPLAERFATLAQTHLADASTIADLAEELGVTTAELDAACHHRHGKRAVDLVHDLRLAKAVQMLRDTGESPARIARMLGYSSLAHLSRAFVSATGRLPDSFRGADQAVSPWG
jgi:AraC family transcriptional activator of pobA